MTPTFARAFTPPPAAHDTLGERLVASRLPGLDGMRAGAVLIVMAYHFGYRIDGGLGVSAFFVLSGFLITRLLLRERQRTGANDLKDFYVRRTLRIFPAYYVYIAVGLAAVLWVGKPINGASVAAAVAYGTNYLNAFTGHPWSYLSHTWSLAVEEQFYLLWPLAFTAIARWSRRPVLVVVGLVAAIAVLRSFVVITGLAPHDYIYNAFEMRLDNLLVGCALALLLDHKRVVAALEAVPAAWWTPIVPLALIAALHLLPAAYYDSVGLTVDAILFAVTIALLLMNARSWIWRWLEWAPVREFGVISYGVYLYQQLVHHLGVVPFVGPAPVRFAMFVALTTILALLSRYLVELPALAYRDRLAAARLNSGAPATSRRTPAAMIDEALK